MNRTSLSRILETLLILLVFIPLALCAKANTDYEIINGIYNIYTEAGLLAWNEAVQRNSSQSAILMADITLTEPEEGSNWTPVRLAGTFDGAGHTITNLTVTDYSEYTGMFSHINGKVTGLGLVNVNVVGSSNVGGLCGYNRGTISDCYSTGAVTGSEYVGGLCGTNYSGSITGCYSTGTVTGLGGDIGGFIGSNYGTITGCYSAGDVGGSSDVGGFCGYNYGTISDCYSIGTVASSGENVGGFCGSNSSGTIIACYSRSTVTGSGEDVGGFCGNNFGTIIAGHSTGDVTGTENVGGFCGYNYKTITGCYSSGTVTGLSEDIGGFCGFNFGIIIASYSTNTVAGTSNVGGFSGYNFGTITNCYSTGDVTGIENVGGFSGYNSKTISSCYLASGTSRLPIGKGSGEVTKIDEKDVAETMMSAMNAAISTIGYEYVANSETSDELLILKKK